MPRLDDCSDHEVGILCLILTLAFDNLPNTLDSYAEALGEMRTRYFKKPNPRRGTAGSWRNARGSNGCVDAHQIRASDPKWRVR